MVRGSKKVVVEKCNICDSEIDQEAGDIIGNFGICPVAFCVWCMSSMTDMVIQLKLVHDLLIHILLSVIIILLEQVMVLY